VDSTELRSFRRRDELIERGVGEEGQALVPRASQVQAEQVVIERDDSLEIAGDASQMPNSFEVGAWRRIDPRRDESWLRFRQSGAGSWRRCSGAVRNGRDYPCAQGGCSRKPPRCGAPLPVAHFSWSVPSQIACGPE
jgi:hypothetical protein